MWAISSLTSFLILWVMPQKHFEKFPLAGRCFVTKTLRLDSDTLFYYESSLSFFLSTGQLTQPLLNAFGSPHHRQSASR